MCAGIAEKTGPVLILESEKLIEDGKNTMGFIREITEGTMTEDALIESRKVLYSLFNHANDAIFLMKDHRLVDCNLKTLDMFGCKKEDIIGKSPISFSTEYQYDGASSLKKGADMLRSAKKGVPQFFEWRHCRKDGSPFDTEVSLNTIELGGEIYIQAIVRDVTEKKRAQEEILRERERLQNLSDNAPFGMILVDPYGRYTYMNARFTELLGYNLSDVPDGRTWFCRAFPDPGNRHKAIGAWKDYFKGPGPYVRYPRVFVVTCKNGTLKTVNLTLSVLSTGDCLMTCEDITEIKRLESRLNQAQKMESLGTLAGGIVHDFNNILTVLMGYASLIQLKLKKDTHVLAYVKQIFLTAQKASELSRQLLTFSRQQPVKPVPIDVNEALRSAEKILRKLLPEDIDLRISLTTDTPVIMADKSQMDQIMFNLVTNAKDAMKKGGTLIIETEIATMDNRFIETHGFGSLGAYVMLSVSDTGEGMDEATREKIFDPFFTTKEAGYGTGLGLATVYGIMKNHNGFITVYSEPGQGTTFRMYLPLTTTPVRREKTIVIPVAKGREKIIIAEDDDEVRRTIREILQEYGYKTVEAVDGRDTIEKFQINPDTALIILDSIMPKMNGWQVYKEISALKPDIKVVFTSGYTKDVIIHKKIEGKIFDFMAKPLLLDNLLNKIREVLDR